MYFTKNGSRIYHILDDLKNGTAPAPCGAMLGGYDRLLLQRGQLSPYVVKDKPRDAQLCKHCERALSSV